MNQPDNIAEKAGSSVLTVDTAHPQERLGDLFGIFFEDINHAADGGLYAEMVQNRSFEFDRIDNPQYHALYAWEKVEEGAQVQLQIETARPYHADSPHYLVMETKGNGRAGIVNLGFGDGFYLEKGETCHLLCQGAGGPGVPAFGERGRDGVLRFSRFCSPGYGMEKI